MSEITRAQRLYCASVGSLALWVGVWGTFDPTRVDRALPWLVPPLHARFLGAVYLSAAWMLANGLVARRQAEVRVMVILITLWTGSLLVMSLFHLDQFDARHKPVWFWFGAYIVYPLAGLWSFCVHGSARADPTHEALPSWARRCLFVQGAAAVLLSLLLLVAPTSMVAAWPWKISALLAQIYSAPFFAYGWCSLLLARSSTWLEARIVVRGTTVLTVCALIASIVHRGVFAPGRVATWTWFGSLGLAAALSIAMQTPILRRKHST
ncbi:MAG: hypothetical protein SGI72_00480 [Planctomycetota bacterium]|nr:hypothetical protein [Planctomycetota bacterium]